MRHAEAEALRELPDRGPLADLRAAGVSLAKLDDLRGSELAVAVQLAACDERFSLLIHARDPSSSRGWRV